MFKNFVDIELDKPRRLLIDFNAMCSFEEAAGKAFLEFADSMTAGTASMKDVRALLWACLIHEDESLTVNRVGELFNYSSVQEVIIKLLDAFKANMPDKKEGDRPLEENRPE